MGCPTECEIGDNLVFSVCTHDPDTGVLTDADTVPDYWVYEDETAVEILSGNMAKFDGKTGHYTELIAVSVGNGFENGKTYTIFIDATVDSDLGGISFAFKAYDDKKANVIRISGSSEAADNLEASAETIVVGAATSTLLTTTQMSTNLTEATNNHYNGRIIIFTSGDLQDQATDITGYDGVTKTLTFTVLTEAPADADAFVIV